MLYRINLHAHSNFSDGSNSPLEMAVEAKKLGFCSLVLTDHFYNGSYPEVSLTLDKMEDYRKALDEARVEIPVIAGAEIPFGGEEILVFGTSAIEEIMLAGALKSKEQLKSIRDRHNCAMILCHPNVHYEDFLYLTDEDGVQHKLLEGYERHNACSDYFRGHEGDLEALKDFVPWHNSDAHGVIMMYFSHNLVDEEITTEEQLISYLKSGKVPGYVLNERN